jgi:predicted RNase H-like HicB family nuclease
MPYYGSMRMIEVDDSSPSFATRGVHAVKFRVVVHPAEEGGFWAEIPALAGCVSEGETLEEVLVNIREAAEGWLEVAEERTPPAENVQFAEIEL